MKLPRWGEYILVWQVTGVDPKRTLVRLCSLSAIWSRGGYILVWAVLDSNQRPPQCQCDALPTALTAQTNKPIQFSTVGSAALNMKYRKLRSLSASPPKLSILFNNKININTTMQKNIFTLLIEKHT